MSGNGGYDNTNTGALFKNERKRTDNSPDYTGECSLVCPHCGATSDTWLSAWIKTAKSSGKKFMSLAFTAKEEASATGSRSSANHNIDDDFDDDIPF